MQGVDSRRALDRPARLGLGVGQLAAPVHRPRRETRDACCLLQCRPAPRVRQQISAQAFEGIVRFEGDQRRDHRGARVQRRRIGASERPIDQPLRPLGLLPPHRDVGQRGEQGRGRLRELVDPPSQAVERPQRGRSGTVIHHARECRRGFERQRQPGICLLEGGDRLLRDGNRHVAPVKDPVGQRQRSGGGCGRAGIGCGRQRLLQVADRAGLPGPPLRYAQPQHQRGALVGGRLGQGPAEVAGGDSGAPRSSALCAAAPSRVTIHGSPLGPVSTRCAATRSVRVRRPGPRSPRRGGAPAVARQARAPRIRPRR